MGEDLDQDVKEPSSSLRQAIEFISSLISLSHSIRVFPVKWQLIRGKLEELNSGLIAAEDFDSGQNPSVSGLLPDVLVTVKDCCDLARRCVDLSYSGKLLMQSDLDVMAARFSQHIKNLSGVYSAGLLTNGFAIVVSKPLLGASKDDMRFYVRDLLTRMKIGDKEMKRQALICLYEVLSEDERYLKLVMEIGDIVNVLVGFLNLPDAEVQEEASKVASFMSGSELCRNVLIGAGVIGPLIRVLESGTGMAKEGAARCLQKLTVNSDNAWSVSAHGGVTALLKLCANGDSGAELIAAACGVLRNLIGVEEIKRFMAEKGAISMFLKLARGKDEIVQVNAIDFLQNIASGDESIHRMVIREGAIRELIHVLDPSSPSSSKTREVALRAVANLCFSSLDCIHTLLTYGFLEKLHSLLCNGGVSSQELALKVTYRISVASEESKRGMGDAGFMPELVRLLDAKSFEVREMAAEALSNLVSVPRNRKQFVQDDKSIGLLLQMLDQQEGNAGTKKLLLSILMSLTNCNSGRRKIASSVHVKNIEKLAEAEGCDAKRLIRKLSTGRFRSIFNGIWHS